MLSRSLLRPIPLCKKPLSQSLAPSLTLVTSRRSMASKAKKEFLCILPDKPNSLERRLQVRPTHYEDVKGLVSSGALVAGGAMLESHAGEGETPAFKGSMIVYTAANAEEVKELIKSDIYARSGVWDVEKAQIIPYVSAVREPLP
ncbi:hypothetical protein P170DRAFT_435127 [Aspergillus steynii IBT 23096]|uniref:YCII-related domain-containing protein n=1 Tax=Aspergillus steynii IBT 23096 TaxID=1392250 RepID=A0A2I2GKW7_9EURO|nr:uncharacterized protein P170DRAFT_435127 [Aspergillus steynii IBT 23096]PLB53515.1 hypothetical protein P170DRAFT_435127 [Aspergillus steynii IBT 23096]